MTRRLPICCATLLLLTGAGRSAAREVYKCTTPAGSIAYQDQPCARDSDEALLHLSDVAPAPPPPAAEAAAAAPAAAPALPPAPQRAIKPLPVIWLCTNAEDGSHYVSRNGPPPPRAVPLGVLGYPGKSLAQAYAPGSNVMSAPELSRPPIDRSPQASVASSYTQLQDVCVEADANQTCAYLRQQLELTRDRLGRARFKDEQGKLQSQVDALEDDLGGC